MISVLQISPSKVNDVENKKTHTKNTLSHVITHLYYQTRRGSVRTHMSSGVKANPTAAFLILMYDL